MMGHCRYQTFLRLCTLDTTVQFMPANALNFPAPFNDLSNDPAELYAA
jgi:hypothetical protein